MEAAARGEVGERVRLEREAVLRRPVAAKVAAQQDAVAAIGEDEVGGVVLGLVGGIVEAQRQAESIAESDVGEPGFVEIDTQGQMIVGRAKAAGLAGDFRGEHGDAKSQLAQQRAEKAVQFVAEAAAPPGDDLAKSAASSSESGRPRWMSRFSKGTV